MTGEELRAALRIIGWRKADLARRIGMHRNTIYTWLAEGPPLWAAEYVRAMMAIKLLHDTFLARPKADAQAVND